MKLGFVIALVIALLSCTNDSVSTLAHLNGKWVDISTKTDTLTFQFFEGKGLMILGRGNEIRGGFALPKYGSGPYDFRLMIDNKIALYWALSSNSEYKEFYFNQSADQLTVENFFDTATPGTLLVFKKLD